MWLTFGLLWMMGVTVSFLFLCTRWRNDNKAILFFSILFLGGAVVQLEARSPINSGVGSSWPWSPDKSPNLWVDHDLHHKNISFFLSFSLGWNFFFLFALSYRLVWIVTLGCFFFLWTHWKSLSWPPLLLTCCFLLRINRSLSFEMGKLIKSERADLEQNSVWYVDQWE